MAELKEPDSQLDLFAPKQSEGEQLEPDSPDKPKPGSFWNGAIWVSDADIPF